MPWFSVRLLRVLTPLTVIMSLVAHGIVLCSNAWIHTEELMQNPLYNGTGDREFLSKFTVSGLWRLCYNDLSFISQKSSTPSSETLENAKYPTPFLPSKKKTDWCYTVYYVKGV
ncbi:uncharacterized protein LOC143255010 isoform X1 [Tachypleus tridentatus]|uniref:uncharacterized protein LOC143255010 isoform X1 n=1 Tax=Tachypleus tridentatus TaxID=6853 RepID=UPI003FD06FD8